MGATEIIFIFAIYLLLFGSKGIPSLAQTMGQAVRTFRNATEDIQREILATDQHAKKDFSNVRDVTEDNKRDVQGPIGDGSFDEDETGKEDESGVNA